MSFLISLAFLILTVVFTIFGVFPSMVRFAPDPLQYFIGTQPLSFLVITIILALLGFTISFGSLFYVRSATLVIGSKRMLLFLALVAIICAVAVGNELAHMLIAQLR